MKRYFTLILTLALLATSLAGCGNRDNVSHNEDGMIESSTTESTAPITVPTTQHTTESTQNTDGLMEDMIPDGSENESTTTPTESTGAGRSRRISPKF